jgi:hypothetical protein
MTVNARHRDVAFARYRLSADEVRFERRCKPI